MERDWVEDCARWRGLMCGNHSCIDKLNMDVEPYDNDGDLVLFVFDYLLTESV